MGRFEVWARGTATALFLFSGLSIYATLAGFGPFAVANHTLSLLLLQGFIATFSLVAFLIQADAFEDARLCRLRGFLSNVSSSCLKVIRSQCGRMMKRRSNFLP